VFFKVHGGYVYTRLKQREVLERPFEVLLYP